jgi:hypothetical protein
MLTLRNKNKFKTRISKIKKKFNIELLNKNALNRENTINKFKKKEVANIT